MKPGDCATSLRICYQNRKILINKVDSGKDALNLELSD